MIEFTAHNIILDNGQTTRPGTTLLKDSGEFRAACRTLDVVFKSKPKGEIRLVDLGCLEGGHSVEFARLGYNVLGIEKRKMNFEKCLYVAEHCHVPNLKFALDDVRNIQHYGNFDVAFCSGILYHLDDPVAFLKNLGRVTKQVIIINTHYATGTAKVLARLLPRPIDRYFLPEITLARARVKNRLQLLLHGLGGSKKIYYPLSRLTTHEGKLGRWFYEYLPKSSPRKIDQLAWAACGNIKSFWLTKKDLLASMRESGFDIVYEQYDFLDDIGQNTYIEDQNRSLFVGIKIT